MYIETEPIKVTFIVNYVTLSSQSVLHNMLQYKGLFPSRLHVLKIIQPFFLFQAPPRKCTRVFSSIT